MTNNLTFQHKYRAKVTFNPERTPPKYLFGTLQEPESAKKHRTQEKMEQMSITALQAQYKSSLNSYQIKFKNLQQEFKRSKLESERKIIELTKEKNHYQNMLHTYSRQNWNDQKKNQLKEKNNDCREGQNSSDIEKLQKNIIELKNQLKCKDMLIALAQKEKTSIQQELRKCKEQNFYLSNERQKLGPENVKLCNQITKLMKQLQKTKENSQKKDLIKNQNINSLNILKIPGLDGHSSGTSPNRDKLKPQNSSSTHHQSKSIQHGHHGHHGHGHHGHDHGKYSVDGTEKIKSLQIMLNKANKKIKQLSDLINQLNESKMATGLVELNKRFKGKY